MIAVVIGVMLGLYILTQMAELLLQAQERGTSPLVLLLAGCTALAALAGIVIILNTAALSPAR